MDIKTRMETKQKRNKSKLLLKNLKLNEIKNSDKYFDFAGNWKKGKKPIKRLTQKNDEAQLLKMLKLESQLNQYITFDPIRDIIQLSNIGYQRHELFDPKTLLHGKKSKP
jgi:hypothetical protein